MYQWIGGSIGRHGFQLNYAVRGRESQVELYIDLGSDSDELNLKLFNELKQHQQEIESQFGGPLEWQDLPDSRACRIRKVVPGGYRSPEAEWVTIHETLVKDMINLDKAMRPFVHALPE